MKVLLVGGLGFIGKRFIRKFSGTHNIIVYATPQCVKKAKTTLDLRNITIEEGRVEEKRIIDVISKSTSDVVVHLAALTGLQKCHDNPEEAFQINVYGTFNVVSACVEAKSKLVFISSREVYGETLNNKSKENDLLYPNNVYGITKMLGEILIKQACKKNNLDYTILRLTNVYGPEGDQYGAQVMIKKAIKENKISILGGSQSLNFVYVDDVVDLINLVLNDKKSSKQVFNVGSKDTLTIEEFADKVSKIIVKNIMFEHLPMRETETSYFRPDLSKLKKHLNFETKTTLELGLKKTIEWYSNEDAHHLLL